MRKQMILGAVLGAIVLFVWSALAWMLIPWPGEPLRSFTNEDAVSQAIRDNAPKSGNYLLPNMVKRTPGMTDAQYDAAMQAAEQKMTRGPVIFAAVRLEPFNSMGRALVINFLTQLVVALMAIFLLLQTNGLTYKSRVIFLVVIGLIIFIGGHMDESTWWSFSNAYMLMQFGAIVIGWLLASLIMAKVVTGKIASA